jgi:hypothetical protein
MKKYLKLALASVFFFSITMTAFAQAPQGAPQGGGFGGGMRQQQPPKERAEALAKDLGLNDDLKAKVQAQFEKNDAATTKFRADVTRDSPDFMEKMQAMRTAQNAELVKIIGQENFDKYQKIQADRRQQGQNQPRN